MATNRLEHVLVVCCCSPQVRVTLCSPIPDREPMTVSVMPEQTAVDLRCHLPPASSASCHFVHNGIVLANDQAQASVLANDCVEFVPALLMSYLCVRVGGEAPPVVAAHCTMWLAG
eukprot:3369373-Alexandrium_andersonii.AAC.2